MEFLIAERLKMTHHELMTGDKKPLSSIEYIRWVAYIRIENDRKAKAAQQAKNKKGK